MAAFQFPDPAVQTTVKNPITGSTYQWQDPPGKWVVTVSIREVGDIVWEGDKKPDPNPGDYKLWYHTEELELYFYYCDENNRCDWIPTSKPITMLEDLDNTVFELRRDLTATNVAVRENENQIGRTIYFGDTAPTIYDDTVYDGVAYPNELNYKFWYDTARLELLILFRDADNDDSYVPVSIPLESLPEPGVSTETFTYTTGRLQTAIEENYLHNLNQDASINELNELIKGKVLKYTFDNNVGTLVTTPGKIGSNSGFWSSINKFSFGTEDANGITTPTMSDGQIIETHSAEENKTNLYKITNASGAPTEVEVDYISGDLFYVSDMELDVYIRDELDDYVKKTGGDTMEGQLIINGPRKAGDDVDNPDLVSSLKVLSIDNAQNSSLQLRHSGNAKVYVGDTDISIASDIKFNRAAGAVVKTNVQDLLNIGESEIAYLGRSIEDEDLITKKYVDDAKDFLQNEIIELEEEIEAIAPSVERGRWTFTAVGTVAQPGQFTMYDADFGNGSPTGLFKSAKSIWFNELDIDGTPHAFGDVDDGELLEIFIDGSSEYGLFSVVGQAHDETQTGTKFWVIDVNFVRALENTTAVGPGELCRFKIFMAPTGGDASGFVMKTGDTMSGRLQLDKPRGDSNNGQGFTVKGAIGNNYSSTTVSEQAGDLLQVYHNANSPDAINYNGKIIGSKNLATKEYVDSKGGVDISCTTSGRSKGDMWYCSSDQVLYIKVS